MKSYPKFSPYVENFLKKYDQTNMVVSNFIDIAQPGIYEIFNLVTEKVYVGQSDNVADRLGRHITDMRLQYSNNAELNIDWKEHGRESYLLRVKGVGPEFSEQKTRKDVEEFIQKRYFNTGVKTYHYRQDPVMRQSNMRSLIKVNGKIYISYSQAAETREIPLRPGSTKAMSRSQIQRKVVHDQNPPYDEWIIVAKIPPDKKRSVMAESQEFFDINKNGFNEIVEKGLAKDTVEVLERIVSTDPKWKEWYFVAENTQKVVQATYMKGNVRMTRVYDIPEE